MTDEDSIGNSNCSRQLRARCKSRMFSEEMWVVSKDEDDVLNNKKPFYTSYNLSDKLKNPIYLDHGYVKEINGYDFNIDYMERHGFTCPLLIRNKYSLSLKMPDHDFSVNNVRKGVGSDRLVDVIDVRSQKDVQMSMKDYQKYYESHDKDKLYNVISLEFSHTKLEDHVTQPSIVRKLDWVDLYWPSALKSRQMDSTNIMKNMMYPKVQKYCLMSVKGCYTDFHVDFGGTSVWYHILKGVKVFWLIPPTDENLILYRDWLLSDKQLDRIKYTFLGEAVDKCERIVLKPGQTFFIPSGWLHAVYTAKDSLVFGGNFLHSYSVEMQIKISRLEIVTHVSKKFQYPYFTELHWYALQGMVKQLISQGNFLDLLCNKPDSDYSNEDRTNADLTGHSHRVNFVQIKRLLKNIKTISTYLKELPYSKKNIPGYFDDPSALLRNAEVLLEKYKDLSENSDDNYSSTMFEDAEEHKNCKRKSISFGYYQPDEKNAVKKFKSVLDTQGAILRKHSNRRRRTRCRVCVACCNDDCGSCIYCKDMVKFGGNGRAKQSCLLRQCLQPVLPSNSTCIICNIGCNEKPSDPLKDGMDDPKNTVDEICTAINLSMNPSSKYPDPTDNDLLMECGLCYEIVHPRCLFEKISDCKAYDIKSNINDDLPNSWKCPKCFVQKQSDKDFFNKQRFFKARSKVIGKFESDRNPDGWSISPELDMSDD